MCLCLMKRNDIGFFVTCAFKSNRVTYLVHKMNFRHAIQLVCENSLSNVTCTRLSAVILQQCRGNASQTKREKKEKIKITVEPPKDLRNDWVGPPDPTSNIRPIKFHIPTDETLLERSYREQRDQVWKWNQEFWENHNTSFFKQKEEFAQAGLEKKQAAHTGDGDPPQTLSPEELSVFYKRFLNENYKSHILYNREWYRRNISLLWPALKITISRLIKQRKQTKKT